MKLKDKELCIKNAEVKDAVILAKWWNDGKVMAHAGFPDGLHISVSEIEEKLKTDSDEKGRRLIIEYADKPIGEMNYSNKGDHIASIGIKICEESCQEKGLGRRCLSLLIRELFDEGYEKIVLDTDLENKRAQHVYELLGFQKVSINFDSWKDQRGMSRSSVDYELKEKDFINHLK